MHKLGWFLFGAVFVLAVEIAAAAVTMTRARGFSTKSEPTAIERTLARLARTSAIPSEAKARRNPVPNTPEVLAEARAHWADHCASCHANDGSGETPMGKHLYPRAPDMRAADTQKLTDGELFFIIQNGVRLTGMPGWSGNSDHDAEDSWKLVRFIRHLPELGIEERRQMEKMNPKGPDEWKEEQEEEKFLKGDINEIQPVHRH